PDPKEGAQMVIEPVEPGRLQMQEPTLAAMMSRVGERISFTLAAAICGVSVVALTIILAFGGWHWRIALILVATASFGAWTLADHERREGNGPLAPRWRILQGVAGLFGITAIFVLLLTLLASALGLWIS
ncbi:MAG: hypothetical protein ABI877_23150, partial [Gemmatimonadaceae bacterium]